MKPGQRVRAVIELEAADGVIAIPRGALFERDGKRVVYRREGGGFAPIEVTVGRNSISRVVVEKGLRDGDRIALRDPLRKEAPTGAPGAAPAPAEGAK
jgi:multidrug efflux pump subunit AcrA (membrane-fusion protein)